MSEHLLQHGTRGPHSQRAKARADQTENSAGGFVWEVDCWTRLRRFLILGSQGGSYYASERALTGENVAVVRECLDADGLATVEEIATISESGRAPKNDQALYALAVAISHGDLATRRAAAEALPRVARIGTHLYDFVAYAETMRGWGKVLRRAVAGWYEEKPAEKLAYDVIKYRQRNGWSHRDLLRLAHPSTSPGAAPIEALIAPPGTRPLTGHAVIYDLVAHSAWEPGAFPIIDGFVKAQAASSPEITAAIVREYGLPREALLTDHLKDPEVWRALLDRKMPIHALTRNLANMTRYGILEGAYRQKVVDALRNEEVIRGSKLHPFSILLALATYRQGHGFRGGNSWTPIPQICDALDEAYYLAFGNVEPTGKNILLALDVSGSMSTPMMDSPITCREGTAALAMVTGAVEANVDCVTFSNGGSAWMKRPEHGKQQFGFQGAQYRDGLEPLDLSKRRRLDDVVRETAARRMGGTDCALPMIYATEQQKKYDAFVVYTDSETWAGGIHPFEALRKYRNLSGIHNARLVVVGMVSNGFSIADPNDPGMLDVVGFDTATPNLISEFIAGRL